MTGNKAMRDQIEEEAREQRQQIEARWRRLGKPTLQGVQFLMDMIEEQRRRIHALEVAGDAMAESFAPKRQVSLKQWNDGMKATVEIWRRVRGGEG